MKNRNTPFTAILFVLAYFALLPGTHAVNPPPDGGYARGNTAEGTSALFSLTTGSGNTATGFKALFSDTTGFGNTATGHSALFSNTTGFSNTASGDNALFRNTIGEGNTAIGQGALGNNTTGPANVAVGAGALAANTNSPSNTAVGTNALIANTTGIENTAVGDEALADNNGDNNSALGHFALFRNTTGSFNTAIGDEALFSNSTGSLNIAIGKAVGDAIITAENVICIGSNFPGANVSNSCFIGNIRGVTTTNADAIPVLIDSAGQLGTMSSSRRFKREIKPIDKASETILALKPVTFHYKSDNTNTPQFGLIAEEVAEVSPDLVVRDHSGEIYTVRYDAVNAMLLNEFLKEHRKVEEQQATITHLQKDFQAVSAGQQEEIQLLRAQLKEQAAQIQKVSVELKLQKAPVQTVVDN